jgi:signal peptidase II
VQRAVCAVTLSVLAGDQLSKSLALAARPGTRGGLLTVRLVRNTGASFGAGAGHPVLVMLVSAVVIAVVAVLLTRTSSTVAALSLAAVAGGALGNFADRVFRSPGLGRGAVIDWIHLAWYSPSFNVADIAIRAGTVGAVVAMLGTRARPGRWPSVSPGMHGRGDNASPGARTQAGAGPQLPRRPGRRGRSVQ